MFDEFRGKAVLVTGATSGIGAAVARALGSYGAKVGVQYSSHQVEALAVTDQIRSALAERDGVTNPEAVVEAVRTIVARFRHLGILVNCPSSEHLAQGGRGCDRLWCHTSLWSTDESAAIEDSPPFAGRRTTVSRRCSRFRSELTRKCRSRRDSEARSCHPNRTLYFR